MRNLICLAWLGGCAPSPPPGPINTTTQPVATPGQLPGIENFARVSPVLYRGAQPSALGFQTLRNMGVRTVVDLRGEIHQDACQGTGLKAIHLPSSASHPSQHEIIEFLRLLRDPANQPLFVHDEHGSIRTGLYVAAYRMVEQGWTAHDAEVEMRAFHFDPFWTQIPRFLETLDVPAVRSELTHPPETQPQTNAEPR